MSKAVLISIVSCFMGLSLLFCGCYSTYDPIPPTLEFYKIESNEAFSDKVELIATRNIGIEEDYGDFYYIKFYDDQGDAWVFSDMSSTNPKHWAIFHIKDGHKIEVELELSNEYQANSYHEFWGKVFSTERHN